VYPTKIAVILAANREAPSRILFDKRVSDISISTGILLSIVEGRSAEALVKCILYHFGTTVAITEYNFKAASYTFEAFRSLVQAYGPNAPLFEDVVILVTYRSVQNLRCPPMEHD
jgi:hypothetical protein